MCSRPPPQASESDVQRALRSHQRNLFVRDFSLDRSFLGKTGDDFLHAVPIETSAGHVLGAAEIAAVCQQNFQPGISKNIRRRCAGQSSSYDYGVKFFFAHSFLLL